MKERKERKKRLAQHHITQTYTKKYCYSCYSAESNGVSELEIVESASNEHLVKIEPEGIRGFDKRAQIFARESNGWHLFMPLTN